MDAQGLAFFCQAAVNSVPSRHETKLRVSVSNVK